MNTDKKTFPARDTKLSDAKAISERIKSIDRQVDKLEFCTSRTMDSFDARHDKIKKLNARKDALWTKRALIIRSNKTIMETT